MTVTQFSAERVPVSLGIAVDTSGSMAGNKIQEAQTALDRLLYDLLDRQDEIFLYRFSNRPVLLQPWTRDRQQLSRALGRLEPSGGTAMYDAVARGHPADAAGAKPEEGAARDLGRQRHRERDHRPRAQGADSGDRSAGLRDRDRRPGRADVAPAAAARGPVQGPSPRPFPGAPGPFGGTPPIFPRQPPTGGGGGSYGGYRRGNPNDDRVNVVALRDMTDDSGGRTEIVRDARDLNPATASIADELSKQYYLGYPSSGKKDGRWHSIRVELKNRAYRVRARRGYVAS